MTGSTPGSIWSALDKSRMAASDASRLEGLACLGNSDYRVIDVHRGGMAEVYICEPLRAGGTGIRFALKTFRKECFLDSTTRIAFLQEAATWARLTGCRQVMPITGLSKIDGRPAIRMLAIQPENGRPLTVAQMLVGAAPAPDIALDIALQVAMGMRDVAIRIPGLVHGDLKPENLLVEGGSVWISDFGLARVHDEQIGALPLDSTWSYQAPEVFNDPAAATPQSDVYSFGILLYELLTGRCPVNASGRELMLEAHRSLALPVLHPAEPEKPSPAHGSTRDLITSLSQLAIRCASFAESDRPVDFATVFDQLHQIAEQHDKVRHLERMMHWQHVKRALDNSRRVTAPQLIQLFFETGDHRFALDLLEDLGVETLSPELSRYYGAVLVLTQKVEEGLAVFERLLTQTDLPAKLRRETEMERALALKRLDRYDEAITIFERLLATDDKMFLARVVTNLATVHLDAQNFSKAERLLSPFCAQYPDNFHAWVNLGFARAWLGDAEAALDALDRATVLNPAVTEPYVMRAAVFMDLLDQPEQAYATLDTAFDQGCESRPMVVRLVVSAMQANRFSTAHIILQALKKRLSKEVFDDIQSEIDALTRDLKDEALRVKPRYRFFLKRAPLQESPPADPSSAANLAVQDQSRTRRFRMPFTNRREYEVDQTFTLDFYYPVTRADYVARFREGLSEHRRQLTLRGSTLHLRTTPFYATCCTGCAVVIMTNRDRGMNLICRRCGTAHAAQPTPKPQLEDLAARLLDTAAMASDGRSLEYLGFAIQLPSDMSTRFIDICTHAEFRQLGAGSTLLGTMIADGVRGGTFDRNLPVLGFLSDAPYPAAIAGNAMPPVIDRLVRRLRSEFRGIRTTSRGVHPDDPIYRFDIHPENLPPRINQLKGLVAAAQSLDEVTLMELAVLLKGAGRVDEALPYAHQLAEARPGNPRYQSILGSIELKLENLDAAITALKKALELDPTDSAHMYLLALAYEKSGNRAAAQKWLSRYAAHGGQMRAIAQSR